MCACTPGPVSSRAPAFETLLRHRKPAGLAHKYVTHVLAAAMPPHDPVVMPDA